MKAIELFRIKQAYGIGIFEIVIWQLPEPVPPSEHPYKYRLVYVVNNERVLGYDNERGKGDHKLVGKIESPYHFTSPAQLMADFMTDIKGLNHE